MNLSIDVVVRCRNEMPWARLMIAAMARQTLAHRVLFMDCGSTDGSREEAVKSGATMLDVDPAKYIPGAVLNRGMANTRSDIVAFVNADAIPHSDDALRALVAPLVKDPSVAAVYGRQLARPGADPLVALEYDRAFGATPPRLARGSFFSMAASAIRRTVWAAMPFDEKLRYSEDVDWTYRIKMLGGRVVYAPRAEFEHSHDYDMRGQLVRRRGEGTADAAIYRLGAPSVVGDLVKPFAGAVLRDTRAGLLGPRALGVRAAQAWGYFSGRKTAAAGSSL